MPRSPPPAAGAARAWRGLRYAALGPMRHGGRAGCTHHADMSHPSRGGVAIIAQATLRRNALTRPGSQRAAAISRGGEAAQRLGAQLSPRLASNWGRARGDGARRRQPRRHRCALRCRQCMAGKSLSVIETSRARRLVRRWTSLNGWHRGTHCDANRNRSCLHPPPVSAAPTSTPSVRRSQVSKLTSFGNVICLAVYLLSIYYLLSCTASFGH